MNVRKPELLAPAGNLEKLKFAVRYGADAVYIGGERFGLRAKAGNFSYEDMREGVRFAHEYGAKVYVAANIIAHADDFDEMDAYFRELERIGIDAVIVADPAIVEVCKEAAQGLEIHLSTQASATNAETIRFWAEEGVTRVVLAREVSIEEIAAIKREVTTEIEAFVHGAMCVAYSGRCVLSNHMTNRDANRGGCAQSCRWKYELVSEDDAPADEEGEASFTMGSKDLCLIEWVPAMIEAGVDSLKIEGRMKTIHYVATVVQAYRRVIDAYADDPERYVFREAWLDELRKAANRPTTTGFALGDPGAEDQIYEATPKSSDYEFAGLVLDYDPETGVATVEQRNAFAVGDEIEWFGPGRDVFGQTLEAIEDEGGARIANAPHPLQRVRLRPAAPVRPYDIMRAKVRK
ncbi:U32 family peptidase [Paenibacillus sp. TRM 82003]|nr:U32 family peptidase [Paenibacillus sp. TRM 82003]